MGIREQLRGIRGNNLSAGKISSVPEANLPGHAQGATPSVASQPEKSAGCVETITGPVRYPEWASLIDRANRITAVVRPHARQAVSDHLSGALTSISPEGLAAFSEAVAATGRLARAILRAGLVVGWLRSPGFTQVERDMADRLEACLEPELLDQAPEVRQGFVRDVAVAWNGYRLDQGPFYDQLPKEVRDEF